MTKPFHEPDENEFLRGDEAPAVDAGAGIYAGLLAGMLEQIDTTMGHLVDHGLERELRAIVAKHLPPAVAPAAPEARSAGAERSPEAQIKSGLKGLTADQVNQLIGLLNCVTVLDEHARRAKADSPSAKRDAFCAAFLRDQIEKLKETTR